jgi:hypothetical protein
VADLGARMREQIVRAEDVERQLTIGWNQCCEQVRGPTQASLDGNFVAAHRRDIARALRAAAELASAVTGIERALDL